MPETRSISMPWTTVATTSTSNEFHPVTGWMSANSVNRLRSTFEIGAINGNMTLSPGYQVANHPDSPGAVYALLVGFDSTVNVFYPVDWTNPTSNTDNKQLIRFGWVAKNSSGTDLSTARVSGQMIIDVS